LFEPNRMWPRAKPMSLIKNMPLGRQGLRALRGTGRDCIEWISCPETSLQAGMGTLVSSRWELRPRGVRR
jgi:hypothetical protein